MPEHDHTAPRMIRTCYEAVLRPWMVKSRISQEEIRGVQRMAELVEHWASPQQVPQFRADMLDPLAEQRNHRVVLQVVHLLCQAMEDLFGAHVEWRRTTLADPYFDLWGDPEAVAVFRSEEDGGKYHMFRFFTFRTGEEQSLGFYVAASYLEAAVGAVVLSLEDGSGEEVSK